MRSLLAILALLAAGLLPSQAADTPAYFTLFWLDASGRTVFETVHQTAKPPGQFVAGFRYGPFTYPCLAPEFVQHGPIRMRTYLRAPSVCYVPPGAKVCLQPATVNHHGVAVIPYLYLGYPPFGGGPQCLVPWTTASPLRPAVLLDASR